MRVTAETIPEEIFGHIVDCVVGASANSDVIPVDVVQAMGNMALVSHWCATVLRRYILREVWVTNHRIAQLAREVLLWTGSGRRLKDPTEFIRKIHIVHDGTDAAVFWSANIILVFNKLPALAQRAQMDIVVRPDPPASCTLGPSMFHCYPRRTPLLFRQFVRLRLHGVRFGFDYHFVELVSEFRSLRQLEVEDSPWDGVAPREVLRPWPYALEDISLRETNRYEHDGRGSFPLLIKAATSFKQPIHIARNKEELPSFLRFRAVEGGSDYPVHHRQAAHLASLMYIFYEPSVSRIVEGDTAITWNIVRLQTWFTMPGTPSK